MNRWMSRLGAVLALGVVSASAVMAGPPAKDPAKPKAEKCPVCHMNLTTGKDKVHTKAVKIGKKTYYCCDGCKMDKKATKS